MTRIVRAAAAPVVVSLLLSAAGCGSSPGAAAPEARKENVQQLALDQVKQMLEIRQGDAPGKAATKAADYAKYEKLCPVGYQRLKSGEIVLIGAPLAADASDTVLAYEKEAPTSGGYVLMQDGSTIKKLSADEFKSAKKAPGKELVAGK